MSFVTGKQLAKLLMKDVIGAFKDGTLIAPRRESRLCPFHVERSPSFSIDHDTQRYHCFGCGAHGPLDTLEARITAKQVMTPGQVKAAVHLIAKTQP
jgi:hypothetical protein